MYILTIDDMRVFDDNDIVVKHSNSAKEIISKVRSIKKLYLDNDLGQDSLTGYDILKWWANEDIPLPLEVVVTTSNPPARNNIEAYLKLLGYAASGHMGSAPVYKRAL